MSLYSKLSRLIQKYKLSQLADIILVLSSGYLLVKKAYGFSISGWLLNNALQQTAVDYCILFSALVLIAAILIKVLTIMLDAFPATRQKVVEPEEISECLQIMNNEIMAHINKCDSAEKISIKKLSEHHSFDVNIRTIAEALAEHICKSIKTIKIKRKDIFISLYTFDATYPSLKYELHYDPKRDLVKTKFIDLSNQTLQDYECVKCMKSSNTTAYILKKSNYAIGNSKRHKSLSHYMGCKLEVNGHVFAFLNLEFHNSQVFTDEEEMQDFMEEHIFPFKLLLEYQYLKAEFFRKFKDFNTYWEAA
jgi:hypothetical protein